MQWLEDRFLTRPNSTAFVHEGRCVSYLEVVGYIDNCFERVVAANIKRGDTVVILGDYSPEVFCLIMALSRHSNIVIPLTRDSVVEETSALSVSGCDWYIEFDDQSEEFQISYRGESSDNLMLADFKEQGSPGIILFSSGSTGKPKAILHDFAKVCEKFRKQRASVVTIPFLMIDHFGGINTILGVVSSLGTVVTVRDRSVANICAAVEKYKVELLPATPSFLTLLIASKSDQRFDLSSLKRITYGTEVMPQTTLTKLVDSFPGVLFQQTYGLSEVGVLRSQSRNDGSLWMRIGGEGFRTKVIDDVLWIKSDFAMVGYLNAESQFDDDGWFNTQDQVEVDGDYFRIIGRVTDLINVGGQKVYPTEIENIILEISNVVDVAVFGEKNSLLGQIIVAKVILENPESIGSLKNRVRKYCLARLAPYKVPSKFIIEESALHSARQKKIRK